MRARHPEAKIRAIGQMKLVNYSGKNRGKWGEMFYDFSHNVDFMKIPRKR